MSKSMHKYVMYLTVFALLIMASSVYGEPLQQAQITPEQLKHLKWSTNPRGIQEAIIIGNPANKGMYLVRSQYPRGLKVNPHFHPDERIVTVLSGTIYLGYGKEFDEKKMKAMPAGSVWTEPAHQPHFSWAKDGEVLIEIIGNGPSGVTPVRP